MTHRLDTVKHLGLAAVTLLGALAQTSCNSIDDDLSDCGIEATVTYEMRLITNMETELATELGEPADAPVQQALRTRLSPIFNERAHDLDLSFYNADDVPALPLLHHEQHIVDAKQATYNIYLPLHRYQNLALANTEGNAQVTIATSTDGTTAALVTAATATAPQPPHATGLFTARLPMDLSQAEGPHTYHAYLYMANCSAALVVDTTGVSPKAITVAVSGLADRFLTNDSPYSSENRIVASAPEVQAPTGHQACYCAVAFPSRDFATRAADNATVWTVIADVDMPDGSTTHNVINVYQPLKAACLKIIKVRMQDDGSFQPVTTEVGVSTSLNWRKGGEYEI